MTLMNLLRQKLSSNHDENTNSETHMAIVETLLSKEKAQTAIEVAAEAKLIAREAHDQLQVLRGLIAGRDIEATLGRRELVAEIISLRQALIDFTTDANILEQRVKQLEVALSIRHQQAQFEMFLRSMSTMHITLRHSDKGPRTSEFPKTSIPSSSEAQNRIISDYIESNHIRGSFAFDYGAKSGVLARNISDNFDTVAAFEPDPILFNALVDNVSRYSRIIPLNLSLASGQSGKQANQPSIADTLNTRNQSNHHITVEQRDKWQLASDPQPTDSHLQLDSLNCPVLDLIRIDNLADNLFPILGAKNTIIRCKPAIIFGWDRSVSQSTGYSIDDAQSLLWSFGFRTGEIAKSSDSRTEYFARFH